MNKTMCRKMVVYHNTKFGNIAKHNPKVILITSLLRPG